MRLSLGAKVSASRVQRTRSMPRRSLTSQSNLFECKGTAVLALPQSHVLGILHTLDMVCDLPSLWDCGIGEIAVPLHPNSNSNDYGKDLCKRRCAGSKPAAQCE